MPIMPRPILLVSFVATLISSTGYLFMSMTLSRNRVDSLIACSQRCQSNSNLPSTLRLTKFARLIEPRLHDSYGYKLCSPHGFVARSGPCLALMHGLYLLMLSKNITPGSALFHALSAIRSISCCASICLTGSRVRGLRSAYLWLPSLLTSTFQKSSQMPTLTLKFSKTPGFVLAVTNFSTSGCQASRMPMLAPRRLPPCFTTSVIVSIILMNEVGPDATPEVEATMSPSGLRSE